MTGDARGAVNGAAGVTDRIWVESFEYNLTEHCNLRCSGCDHASPFLKERFASLDEFQRDLRQLATALGANEIKLVGGEPLLHPQLLEFARVAKQTGIARLVTLVTNGVLLHELDERVWATIDRLWISIYPGVKIRADLTDIQRIADRHHVELWQKRNSHFRVTLLNHPHHDPNLAREIFAKCGLAHEFSCHTLYDGRYYRCSPGPFIEPRLAARGVTFANRLTDSVPIHDNAELRTALAAYLRAENPLAGCSYCLGTTGTRRLHRQLNGSELAAELNEDHSDTTRLIDVELLRVKPRDVWPPEITNKPPWHETEVGPS
jgi:Radical SAM superfamily/4Fe-4S single cluster domain